MDSAFQQVAQRSMDQPLPFDARLADEGGAFDFQAEVGFAGGIIAAVPAMLLAVVGERQGGGFQRRFEPAPHFARHRSLQSVRHSLYIERF